MLFRSDLILADAAPGDPRDLQVTEDHFEKALRNLLQQPAVLPRTGSQTDYPQMKQPPCGAGGCGRVHLGAKPASGSGWESNPPGPFSEATLGLKPRTVTRSAYTPEEINRKSLVLGSQFLHRLRAVMPGSP